MSIVVRYQPKSLTAEKYDATNEQLAAAGVRRAPDAALGGGRHRDVRRAPGVRGP
jgi:hypothetical protein